MKAKFFSILFFLVFLPYSLPAQCAMCRAVLQSQEDPSTARGINNGIMYLMVFPYILIGAIAYFIYRSLKKDASESNTPN